MKRFFKSLFYLPEHEKLTDRNIVRLLMPSVIGIVICVVCMAGMSLAWFSANAQTQLQDIKSADYGVNVTVEKINDSAGIEPSREIVTPESDGRFLLYEDNKYEITITAFGTATKGYCVIQCDELAPQYTDVIATGNHLVYTYTSQTGGLYSFKGSWGTCTSDPDTRIKNGDVVGMSEENATPDNLPSDQSGNVTGETDLDVPPVQTPVSDGATADVPPVDNGEQPTETSGEAVDEPQADNTPQSNQSIGNVQPSQTLESVLDSTNQNQPSDGTVENTDGIEDGEDVPVNSDVSNSENSTDTSISTDNTASAD